MRNIIDQFYSAVKTGDSESLAALIHDDFTLACPTREHVLSGLYKGKTRFFTEVLPHVFGCAQDGDITFCADHRVLCVEGEIGLALAHNKGCARGNEPYEQIYLHVFRVVDGQIRALIEGFDTALANRALWADVGSLEADAPFSLDALSGLGFRGSPA